MVLVEIESEYKKIQTNLRALPNISVFSELMAKTLGSLMISSNSLKIKPSSSGATIIGVPICTLGGGKLKIGDNDYELTPEIYKALSYTGYTGKIMEDEKDILIKYYFKNDLG